MPIQPRTPPGVLELLPPQQLAFQRMLDTIRRGFERFGFLPVETPAFELVDVLLTKTGGETEKQVYFVQSTGAIKEGKAPELALRFDLTVPLARYVAEHEHQLNFPFRRYQIQRVYRGERNQKGRYREFYQCDIDVIGKDTLPFTYDAELPAIIHGIFTELAFGKFTIKLNNRKLLRGILVGFDIPVEKHGAVLNEVDRLGKMSAADVTARLSEAGVANAQALLDVLTADLDALAAKPFDNADFREGLAELRTVYDGTMALGVPASALKIDLSIARGLDYYTGTVYETFLDDLPKLGSICSGGRYADLAGLYTKSKLPGVGISIGVTRLLSHLLESPQFGAGAAVAQVLVAAVEPGLRTRYAELARDLRAHFNVEVYGSDDKLGKQFRYADRAGVGVVALVGSREAEAGVVKLRHMKSGEERDVPAADVVDAVRAMLVS